MRVPGSRRRALGVVAVALLGAVVVGQRLDQALAPPAAGVGRAGAERLVPARTLDEVARPPAGFAGPGRMDEDPTDGARTRRTWFAHGRWWAVLSGGSGAGAPRIWTLAGRDGPWVDTGVQVDDRPFAAPWVAWDGTRLLVATTGSRAYRSHGLRVHRFSWDPAGNTWRPEPDFPVQVTDVGEPGTQLVLDGEGRAWLARLDGRRLLVTRSDAENLAYPAFEPLPGGLAAADVGSFSLTLDDRGPRLVWRSATEDRLTVAGLVDGTWSAVEHDVYGAAGTETIEAQPAGPSRPGDLAVLLTSSLPQRSPNDQDPSILLAMVNAERVTVSTVAVSADQLRGPRLVVDPAAGRVHVLSVAEAPDPLPGAPTGPETITEKSASLDDLLFATGPGTAVLSPPTATLQAVTAPTAVTDESGLLVVASSRDQASWWTAQRGGPTTVTGAPTAPDGTMLEDTFDRLAVGSTPRSWFADGQPALEAVVSADADGGQSLVLTNRDAGEAGTACRPVPTSAVGAVTVVAELRLDGLGTADARLLTVKGPEGALASIRVTRKGLLGYATPDGRVDQTFFTGGTVRVTIRIDRERAVADLLVASVEGTVLMDVRDRPLLSAPGGGPEAACATPPPGNPAAALALRSLRASQG